MLFSTINITNFNQSKKNRFKYFINTAHMFKMFCPKLGGLVLKTSFFV